MADPIENFNCEVLANVKSLATDSELKRKTVDWITHSATHKYSYNYSWLGRPIIQYPQDMVAVQELIWQVKPDLVIETGIAHGGSLVLSASMLALIDYCEAVEAGSMLNPSQPKRRVLGIDIDIRAHNRAAIEAHPMASRIELLQGSSIDPAIVSEVTRRAEAAERVLVFLDSNHTHDHVLAELMAYAPLTSMGSYCVVFDTVIENMPKEMFPDRPWGPGDNPMTAVDAYLATTDAFEIDTSIDAKLQISVAPRGYLRRVS